MVKMLPDTIIAQIPANQNDRLYNDFSGLIQCFEDWSLAGAAWAVRPPGVMFWL